MIQVDKKALYIKKGYETGRDIVQSYHTPIAIIDNQKIITSDKKYSTTTSKHKSHVINKVYKGYQVITIPHKTLKEIIENEGVDLGRM
jgi:transaldolase